MRKSFWSDFRGGLVAVLSLIIYIGLGVAGLWSLIDPYSWIVQSVLGLGFVGGLSWQVIKPQIELNRIRNSRPKIEFISYQYSSREIGGVGNSGFTFYVFHFSNRPVEHTVDSAGRNVSAEIRMHMNGDINVYAQPRVGLWESPVVAATNGNSGIIDRTEVQVDLPSSGLPGRLIVAIKYHQDDVAYLITPDSKKYGDWRNPFNIVAIGNHVLHIRISGDNANPAEYNFPFSVLGANSNIDILPSEYLKPFKGKNDSKETTKRKTRT
jgi:hypothetical protein